MEIYCNTCTLKINSSVSFYITNCKHVFCARCIEGKKACNVCATPLRLLQISSNMSKSIAVYFYKYADVLKYYADIKNEKMEGLKQDDSNLEEITKFKISQLSYTVEALEAKYQAEVAESKKKEMTIQSLRKQNEQLSEECQRYKSEVKRLQALRETTELFSTPAQMMIGRDVMPKMDTKTRPDQTNLLNFSLYQESRRPATTDPMGNFFDAFDSNPLITSVPERQPVPAVIEPLPPLPQVLPQRSAPFNYPNIEATARNNPSDSRSSNTLANLFENEKMSPPPHGGIKANKFYHVTQQPNKATSSAVSSHTNMLQSAYFSVKESDGPRANNTKSGDPAVVINQVNRESINMLNSNQNSSNNQSMLYKTPNNQPASRYPNNRSEIPSKDKNDLINTSRSSISSLNSVKVNQIPKETICLKEQLRKLRK